MKNPMSLTNSVSKQNEELYSTFHFSQGLTIPLLLQQIATITFKNQDGRRFVVKLVVHILETTIQQQYQRKSKELAFWKNLMVCA